MSPERDEGCLEILGADGSVERRVALGDEGLVIGRRTPGLGFEQDTEMAERHARLERSGAEARLVDSGEGSGVWIRVDDVAGRLLSLGDQVWLGSQILVVGRDEQAAWQLRHHGPDGDPIATHVVPDSGLFVGRASELVLDPDDRRLSRRHAQIVVEAGGLRLYDRGAHNGTFLKVTGSEPLESGSEFRLGRQRLRYRTTSPERERRAPVEPLRTRGLASRLRRLDVARREASPGAPPQGLAAASSAGEPSPRTTAPGEADPETARSRLGDPVRIVLDSDEGSLTIETHAGRTVLEAVREAGLERGQPIDWECGDGGCGVCIVGVVEGAERLDPPDPGSDEMHTIHVTERVVPDPMRYRLACLARVRGPVRLRTHERAS